MCAELTPYRGHNSTHIAFDRLGAGPPLVLIHGIGSRRGAWGPVVERLTGEREVIAVDLPGFGDSPPLAEEPTVEALAGAVQAFLVEEGIERPHVAGNSLGGGIALELGRRGAVASVTALSPIGFWSPAERRYGKAVLHLTHGIATHAQPLVLRLAARPLGRQLAFGHLFARPKRRDPREAALDAKALVQAPGWKRTLPAIQSYIFEGDAIAVHTTIAWGTHDHLLIPRQAERAKAALPRARHVPLPGCGHVPMSDDPDGIAALLLQASA